MTSGNHAEEIARGERFAFGRNWQDFLRLLDDQRIGEAERSLCDMLGTARLDGLAFLDAGCGSGLFSLAARRLGARVRSFDFDPQSVACASELKARYFPADPAWEISSGSVLDEAFMGSLRGFDITYSWGVLHHTGHMWKALDLVSCTVRHGGALFIAIYNEQALWSRFWLAVKRIYCSGVAGRWLVCAIFLPYFVLRCAAPDLLRLRNPARRYAEYARKTRGMSLLHDWIDWLGGYPFEVATPEAIFAFCHARGFDLKRLTTCGGGWGCNQFVLRNGRAAAG